MSRFTGYYRPKASRDYGYVINNLPGIGNFIRAGDEAKRWTDYKRRFPAVERRGGVLYQNARYGRSLKGGIGETMGALYGANRVAKNLYR